MRERIEKLYRGFAGACDLFQAPFLLAVRLYWGWQMTQTGWGKLSDLSKVTGFFTQLGIPAPAPSAAFISGLEFAGGILLAAGLGSRLVALLLACDMTVAFLAADREALFAVFSDPDKLYAAAPYPFLFASLIVLFFGPGLLSLDAIVLKRRTRGAGKPAEETAPI